MGKKGFPLVGLWLAGGKFNFPAFTLPPMIRSLSTPVHVVVQKLDVHPTAQVAVKHCVAVGFILTGSAMAVTHQSIIPLAIWDGIAYTIHGFGAAPLIETALGMCPFLKHQHKPAPRHESDDLENPS